MKDVLTVGVLTMFTQAGVSTTEVIKHEVKNEVKEAGESSVEKKIDKKLKKEKRKIEAKAVKAIL